MNPFENDDRNDLIGQRRCPECGAEALVQSIDTKICSACGARFDDGDIPQKQA